MDRLRDRALFRGDIEGAGSEKLRSIVELEFGRHKKGKCASCYSFITYLTSVSPFFSFSFHFNF